MKNKLYIPFLLLVSSLGYSQVKDVSFTLSPYAEYTWWNDQAGFENGTLVGGKLGFGFGEYVELRAMYLQSMDLKTNFDKFGIAGYDSSLFTSQDINLTRWGGEVKVNIGTGRLSPYLTAGTGVQNIEIDATEEEFEQIYTSFGLGIKTKLTDRIVFTLEGKNTLYNFDAGKNLLTDADKTAFGVTDADFSSDLLDNWSVQGSLQFYLGGRKPGTLSELDKAYLQKFRRGFKGIQWVVEPSANYIEFDNASSFNNTWLLGAYAGVDFNRFIGVRAFYLQATENDELSTNFDKMSMYGLEFRARLNDGNGVTPYLILGGGYLNPESSYEGKSGPGVVVDGEEFASAGLGLNIPLGRNFLITGGARAMVTSSLDVEDLTGPDALQTHMMYNAGIKMTFGAKSKDPKDIYNNQLNNALDEQDRIAQEAFAEKLAIQKQANDEKLNKLREEYQSRLDSLQVELQDAYDRDDVEKAVEVLEAKKEAKKDLEEVEKVSNKSNAKAIQPIATSNTVNETKIIEKTIIKEVPVTNQPKELIKMTPNELETLIDKILDDSNSSKGSNNNSNDSYNNEQLNKRIDFLEKLILQMNESSSTEKKNDVSTSNDELLLKMQELKLQLELNSKKMDLMNSGDKTIIINPNENGEQTVVVVEESIEPVIEEEIVEEEKEIKEGRFIKNERVSNLSESLTYKGASGFVGVNVGGQTTPSIGVRMNYGLPNTKIEFMPEFYYGIGNPSAFGISGNFVYPFKALKYSDFMTPYAGIGVGGLRKDGDFKLNHNMIVGTNLKFGKGRVFVDYTSRNFLKYNQIAVGYRMSF